MKRIAAVLLSALPWLVIMLLLTAAIYLEPAGVSKATQPPVVSSQDQFYDVAYANPDAYWMVGLLSKIAHSSDAGATWTEQSSPVKATLQSVAAWDHERLVAVGDEATVIRTEDGGKNWQQVDAPRSEIANKFLRVVVFADDSAWVVGEYGALLQSTDFGRTWERMREPEDVAWHDIGGHGDMRCAVGEFGRVLFSEDAGQTWEEIDAPVSRTLNAVTFRDAKHGVAVGLQGIVVVTEDGGKTWRQQPPVTIEHLFSVLWDGSKWLAAGDKGVFITAGEIDGPWQLERLSEQDYAWHTGMAPGVLFVGASNGFLTPDGWQNLTGGRKP